MDIGDLITTWLNRGIAWLDGPGWSVALSMAAYGLFVLAVLVIVAVVARQVLSHHNLAASRRRRYVLRAARGTEWTMDDVDLWAAQLSMIRRRYRVFLDRPAHAVRFRLQATPQGARYTIEGSSRIERIMLNPALPGLEVTRMHTAPGATVRHEPPGPPIPPML